MNVPLLDLQEQYRSIACDIDPVIRRLMESQQFIMGPEVKAFEEEIAEYVGARFGIGVASGTDALLLSLRALDAEPGSEVIVPSFTFFATAGAVWNAGLKPVFCDVDPDTFNVTVNAIEAVWTDKTVAVIPVHLFGQMASMAGLMELARERGAFVLEDCAQSIGASSAEGKAGAVGNAGAFSFFPSKNLGGFGDGGMVTTNDQVLAERVGKLRVHGGKKMYVHETVGTNSRLDALQAAVLRVKLGYLEAWTNRRRDNASAYDKLLSDIEGLHLPRVLEGHRHVYNQYTVRTKQRDELKEHLTNAGIGHGIYYPAPLHLQQCFAALGGKNGDLPVAETLCREVISLPIFPELGCERLTCVAKSIRSFFG